MTDRKRDQDCPLRLAQERQIDPLADVLRDRTPPEARLGPYPADDLVETPAPRPSLAPFGSASAEGKKHRAALSAATDFVELHARSAFSFLHGASLPEDLAAAAAEAGHAVFGLADVGGVYGAPRFHTAARNAGMRPLVGAELEIEGAGTLTLLCEDRQGYKNLCRLLTLGHDGREKGQCRVTLVQLADFRRGLVALAAGAPDELVAAAGALGTQAVYAEVQRHLDPAEERENRRRLDAARARGLRVVAGGGIRHATPQLKPLYDALTCIRLKTTLDAAGRSLCRNAERHVRPAAESAALFRDLPDAIRNTRAVAERCAFTLEDLG